MQGHVTSISVTASSQLESLVASGSKTIVSVDIQALKMKNLDVHDNKLGQKEGEFTLGTVTIKKSGSTSCSSFTSWGGLPIESICASGNILKATGSITKPTADGVSSSFQWMYCSSDGTIDAKVSCKGDSGLFWGHQDTYAIRIYRNGTVEKKENRDAWHTGAFGSNSSSVSIEDYVPKGQMGDLYRITIAYFSEGLDVGAVEGSTGSYTVYPFGE